MAEIASARDSGQGLRLAELVCALSLAVDLGLGQPTERVLRSSAIGLRLAERLALSEEERAAIYYAALIAWVGCHADAHEQAQWFGDDIALKRDIYEVDMVGLLAAGFFVRHLAGAPELPGGLTPREIDVLRLLVRRLTNPQIAKRLVVSPKTVSNHVKHIYIKAGVNSRAAASLFAMRHGLIDDAEI